ncbi:MAG: 50S ribosomal protein L15 [Hyphomicrobiales bacterium]|nr:50S ribosomal protein L15 [Hyphomicrobiales bacterium]
MDLSDLRPAEGSNRPRKRVGRGTGSGHGKTSGKGQKGQKARSGTSVGRWFEGGQLPLQKRMPYKRGFTNIFAAQWEVVNLDRIAALGVSEITPEVLYERGVIRGLEFPVKVLGDGKLTTAVKVSAHAFSESAKSQIEAAGGSVETVERTDRWVTARPRSRRLPLNRELKQAGFGKVGGPATRDETDG